MAAALSGLLAIPSAQTAKACQAIAPAPCPRRRAHDVVVSRRFQCRAAALGPSCLDEPDPDSYEEHVDDPDEYRLAEVDSSAAGSRPGTSSEVVVGAAVGAGVRDRKMLTPASPARSSSNEGSIGAGQQAHQPSWTPSPIAPTRAFAMLLLFGGWMSRLLSRLSTAVLATGRVTWQLGGEALNGLRINALRAKDRVAESLSGLKSSTATHKVQKLQKKLDALQQELPEDLWGKVMWVWDRPDVQKLRLTIFMANFSFRLPALVALVATQIGLLSTSLSLPMLAPLLLGTGMLLRSIRTNASLLFPRLGLLVVLLWLLWFANSVIANTVSYLRKQGAIDQRMANNINSGTELAVLMTAAVILLSMLGVNVSALLLPAGIALALAAKDLSHNFLAGLHLMAAQPFRLGDRVSVTLQAGSPGGFGAAGPWFEGVCEKVDLRYTSLRQGKRRLMVPNSAFLQQPFMIMEDTPCSPGSSGGGGPDMPPPGAPGPGAPPGYQSFITPDNRHVWQSYMNGSPVHQELAREAAPPSVVPPQAAGPVPQPGRPADGVEAQQQQQQQQQQQVWQQSAWPQAVPPPQQHHMASQASGEPHAPQQLQQQQFMGMPAPHQHQSPADPLSYSSAAPLPGSYPAAAPPGGYALHPRSHPLPPQAFM